MTQFCLWMEAIELFIQSMIVILQLNCSGHQDASKIVAGGESISFLVVRWCEASFKNLLTIRGSLWSEKL